MKWEGGFPVPVLPEAESLDQAWGGALHRT